MMCFLHSNAWIVPIVTLKRPTPDWQTDWKVGLESVWRCDRGITAVRSDRRKDLSRVEQGENLDLTLTSFDILYINQAWISHQIWTLVEWRAKGFQNTLTYISSRSDFHTQVYSSQLSDMRFDTSSLVSHTDFRNWHGFNSPTIPLISFKKKVF